MLISKRLCLPCLPGVGIFCSSIHLRAPLNSSFNPISHNVDNPSTIVTAMRHQSFAWPLSGLRSSRPQAFFWYPRHVCRIASRTSSAHGSASRCDLRSSSSDHLFVHSAGQVAFRAAGSSVGPGGLGSPLLMSSILLATRMGCSSFSFHSKTMLLPSLPLGTAPLAWWISRTAPSGMFFGPLPFWNVRWAAAFEVKAEGRSLKGLLMRRSVSTSSSKASWMSFTSPMKPMNICDCEFPASLGCGECAPMAKPVLLLLATLRVPTGAWVTGKT
mmetsp:Transcript_94840/g.237875  ORF Transcript_94840/g.237875 Transcript_94840/m.237875 type:complete len:272 (-) Transcript_94840:860-1675(-)